MAKSLSSAYPKAKVVGSIYKSFYSALGQGYISPTSDPAIANNGWNYWQNGVLVDTDPSGVPSVDSGWRIDKKFELRHRNY